MELVFHYFAPHSLSRIIERKRILAEAQGRVLLARRRIELIKQVYESSKSSLQQGKSNLIDQRDTSVINI